MNQPEMIEALPMSDGAQIPQTELLGRWPGVVVSTEDPLRLGRVQVRVPQVYGDPEGDDEFIPDDELPWALPSLPVHDYHADFESGDGVWVMFWGGLARQPIWLGQYLGDGDAPSEFTSSYTPTPKTRILRTTNGHIIEMRWVEGQERIRVLTAGGSEILMADSPAEGGPLISATTPAGLQATLDDLQQLIRLQTLTQTVEMLDASQTINVITPGLVNVTAGGAASITGAGINLTSTGSQPSNMIGGGTSVLTYVGAAVWTFLSLALTVTAALTLTAAGLLTITGAGVVILTTGAAIGLGAAGLKFKLVDERFLVFFDAHVHGGPGSPPTTSAVAAAAGFTTQNTEAN